MPSRVTAAALGVVFAGSAVVMVLAVAVAAERMADPLFAMFVAGCDVAAAIFAVLAPAVDVQQGDFLSSRLFEKHLHLFIVRAVLMAILAVNPLVSVLVLLPWQAIIVGLDCAVYAWTDDPGLGLFRALSLYGQDGDRPHWVPVVTTRWRRV